MRKAIISLVCIIFAFQLSAQKRVLTDDTISTQFSKGIDGLSFQDLEYYKLTGFQQYRPFGTERMPLARGGNLGLPIQSYLLSYQDWDITHHIGGYQPYLMKKDSMIYYKASRPFTQLRYTNGSEEEQIFQVLHTQNLGEGLNISFEYQRITSKGYYARQLTNHTQFNSTYNLKSRSGKFRSRGYFLINNMEAQENGGVVVIDDDNDAIVLDVNLRVSQNRSRTQSVGTKNEYDIWSSDSSNRSLGISHEISWSKSYRNYKDDFSSFSNTFYPVSSFDTTIFTDSSFTQSLVNTFMLNGFNSQLNLGFRNEQYNYFQNFLLEEDFSSNYVLFNINGEVFGIKINTNFEKGLSGFHKEELDWRTTFQFKEWKGIKNSVTIHETKKRADYFVENQRLNHTSFSTSLSTSNTSSITLNTKVDKWNLRIRVGYEELENFIYLDSSITPQQHEEVISNPFIELNKRFHFFKHWNTNHRFRFQGGSEKEVVPLPKFTSYQSVYYENRLFKESFTIQLGADVYFIGNYRGYGYSPDLAQFYLNKESEELGNVVQVDLFMNMLINKSARLFVKMENINSSSFSEETNRIQNYPIPGRTLKVGLSWRMIN